MTECKHKKYDQAVIVTDTEELHHWICVKCGATGTDSMVPTESDYADVRGSQWR